MPAIEMVSSHPCRQHFHYFLGSTGTIGVQEGFWHACDRLHDTLSGHPILWGDCLPRRIGRSPGTQHRPFVDRHVERLSLPQDLTSELPAFGFQLLSRPQQCGVMGQMQHGRTPHTPRVYHGWALLA
jgi:hypothetical protein